MTPIDVIANAIRTANGNNVLDSGSLAEVAAKALTEPFIRANAVGALNAGGWGDYLTAEKLHEIADTVLRSVGGG